MSITREQIDRLVRETVAEVTALDVDLIQESTQLLDINMDSLTLVAIVTRIETWSCTAFDAAELIEILQARRVSELSAVVARRLLG